MPSLFGRQSTKKNKSGTIGSPAKTSFQVTARQKVVHDGPDVAVKGELGEFGALPKTPSARTLPSRYNLPMTPPDSPRSLTSLASLPQTPALPPKYSFLPTCIPPQTSSDNSIDSFKYSSDDITGLRPYGFLGGIGSKIVLGVEDAGRAVKLVSEELIRRGLTAPLLFSNQALELNKVRTKILIQSFIESIPDGSSGSKSPKRPDQWTQDLQFAKEHELAWLLRWALSRITRIREGTRQICHGVIEWEVYEEWRGRERCNYPIDAFPFLETLISGIAYTEILQPLFHLLCRLTAHSHLSGLTPHAIASLFAPLIFDVPADAPPLDSHAIFVRAANATEHLLLSYIRSTGSSSSLGLTDLPARLKEWVRGYPSMIASDGDLARGAPRKGAKVVRCERATRTVRAYTKDLVSGGETWMDEASWDAFHRVRVQAIRGEGSRPKFSAGYRKRLCVKETPLLPTSRETQETEYGLAKLETPLHNGHGANRSRVKEKEKEDEGIWASLAGKEWSMFEQGGFELSRHEDDMKQRLRFDLNESAKLTIAERRKTVDWTEFASPSGGFLRTDPLLAVSLGFSEPVNQEIADWPKHQEDLRKRLHKAQKEAIPFHYDTTIRVGPAASQGDANVTVDQAGRVYLEEAFVDIWADLMIGAGWMDRGELTFRESNWAIIEYKAKPRDAQVTHPREDPRTSELYFLLEERVPLDYQLALAAPSQKTRWNIFTPRKKRVPETPSSGGGIMTTPGWAESEFDKMLLHRSATKRVTLSKPSSATVWHLAHPTLHGSPNAHVVSPTKSKPPSRNAGALKATRQLNGTNSSVPLFLGSSGPTKAKPKKREEEKDDPRVSESKSIFFNKGTSGASPEKNRTLRRVTTNEQNKEQWKSEKVQDVEYELDSASGLSSGDTSPDNGVRGVKKEDDKWMDILVANGARRMNRQDATAPVPRAPQARTPGLPVSPHPPARHPSPNPPNGVSSHRKQPPPLYSTPMDAAAGAHENGYDHIDPYAPYSDPPSPNGIHHHHHHHHRTLKDDSPDYDNETYGQGDQTPRAIHWVDHMPSINTDMPVPPSSEGHGFDYQSEEDHGTTESAGGGGGQILAPSPQRAPQRILRDTIHGIVDTYRDSAYSDADEDFDVDGEEQRRGRNSGISTTSALSSEGTREQYQQEQEGEGEQEIAGAEKRFEADKLVAPGPIFDLTPGREPSPARYRHGEPLHKVGEEPEEEEEEEEAAWPPPPPPPRRPWTTRAA